VLDVLWRACSVHAQDAVEMSVVAHEAELVLLQTFTAGLVKLLRQDRSPTRFLALLHTPDPIEKPWLRWTPEMRAELAQWAEEEAEDIAEAARKSSRWPLWSVQVRAVCGGGPFVSGCQAR
jgi:hypothetical protein